MKAYPLVHSDIAGVVQVAAWAKWSWLRAGFSTRQGGETSAYGDGEQNLGWTTEDDPAVVARNRARFVEAVAGPAKVELVTIRQVHGAVIQTVAGNHGVLATEDGKAMLQGDGLMTDLPGLMLGVQTADCVPVLLADTRTRAVAAFHAGWRGTLAQIVEQGVATMRLRYGSREEDLFAAIGPAIGACCFAIGDEVKAAFESQFAYAHTLFSNTGPQLHMDLIEANRQQLVDAGVGADQISVVSECSACTRLESGRRKYFSHRAEQGFTGRMLSVIGVAAES